MSSLLCSLLVVQFCIVQLFLIPSCWPQLTAGKFLCQDPIVSSPRLMSNHGREELDGHCSDSIFSYEEFADEEGFASDGGGVALGEYDEGWLRDDDGGGGAKGSSSGSGGSGDVECPECGKFFKNDKSMFGHLRSHPNRGYKGATPPVSKLRLSPEAASPSSLSLSRGTTYQPQHWRDPQLIPLELVAPYALLTLRCGDNINRATQQAPPPPYFHGNETNIGVSKQTEVKIEVESGGQINSCSMASAEAHCPVFKIPKKKRNMLKEVREAHRKRAKLGPPPPPPPKEKGPYICKHCYAEFSTHQALGGHSAGHHRDKKVQTLNDASSGPHHQGMAAQSQNGKLQVKGGGDDDNGWCDSGVSQRRGMLSEQLSMASNVSRQSGQASGGKMIDRRQQHSGRKRDGLTLAAPTPTPTQADDKGGRRLLNIDLNAEATEHE